MDEGNAVILSRILKMILFFVFFFSLVFFVTWQNVQMHLLQRKVDELGAKRAILQKSLYLKNIELTTLQSRERIKGIAVEELGMVPVSYKDIRLVVFE